MRQSSPWDPERKMIGIIFDKVRAHVLLVRFPQSSQITLYISVSPNKVGITAIWWQVVCLSLIFTYP